MIDKSDRQPMAVTVDLVIFTVRDDALQVLLVERGNKPFAGMAALPGGYVRAGEDLDAAARRELGEETGLDGRMLHLQQLKTYGDPNRDTRGRVVTVAYLALGPDLPAPVAGTDARDARWVPVDAALAEPLAFDHQTILRDGRERARSQLEYTTVGAAFCPEPFTISDLRRIYEVIWGIPLDPSNFRRKITHTKDFLTAIGQRRAPEVGRPAALYRRGTAEVLFPPLLRPGDQSTGVAKLP
jgi:8-oxo-dGTP diphosphatase